jgi:hypothetical protein
MKRLLIISAAILLAGCSTFKLGGMLYCPHGQVCEASIAPPAAAK